MQISFYYYLNLTANVNICGYADENQAEPGHILRLGQFNHPTDVGSRKLNKQFFTSTVPGPIAIDGHVYSAHCIDAAIDGLSKPYICPARLSNVNDGSATEEVLLQILVTGCSEKRLDAYIRNDDGNVYYQNNFPKMLRSKEVVTDPTKSISFKEAKQYVLLYLKTAPEAFDADRQKASEEREKKKLEEKLPDNEFTSKKKGKPGRNKRHVQSRERTASQPLQGP